LTEETPEAVDLSAIGEVAMALMDDIREEYGPETQVTDALLIVELADEDMSTVQWRSTTDRPSVQVGLARLALKGLETEDETPDQDED
jgi:hypothetical protein